MTYNGLIKISIALVLVITCCQGTKQKSGRQSTEEIAHEIIESSGTCTLITLDSSGFPKARIMDPFTPEKNFIIWFGTNTRSRKWKEIQNDSRATVNFYNKEWGAYVSLYGKAEVIDDLDLKLTYWKSSWQQFYPNYPDGYSLIKFTPNYLEFISEKHEITGDSITWKPDTITF